MLIQNGKLLNVWMVVSQVKRNVIVVEGPPMA